MTVKAPLPDPVRDALPGILKAHLPDHPLESAFRMPGGREKYVLRCFGIQDPLVLRVYGPGPEERAALENGLKVGQLLSGAGGKAGKEAPTYRMVGFDETGATAPFLYRLSTMLWGADAETLLEGELGEDDVARIGTALGGAAAAIHGVSADGFGEPRLPAHAREKTLATAVLQVIEGAVRDAQRKGEMSEGAFERIAARADPLFDLLAEAGSRGTLVHGDLRPSSIIVRRGEGVFRLVGVVRLDHGRFLDPAYDLATLEADAFARFPALRAPFYKAYSERRELPPDLDLRLTLYEAIRALLA